MNKRVRVLSIWKNLLPNIAGNAIEYYNIFLFTFLTNTFIKNFLPFADKTLSTALYFLLIYFLPSIAAISGAYFFGVLGDKYGRQRALNYSVLSMGFCSIIISLLPTYKKIGLTAPILLFTLRSLQGFFAAGEYNGGIICCIEHASKKIYGTVSGIYCAATALGILFAAIVSSIIYCVNDNLWRLALAFSGIITLIIYYYRKNIPESIVFINSKTSVLKTDNNIKNILYVMILSCFFSMIYGFAIKILPTVYDLQSEGEISPFYISLKNCFLLLLYIIFLYISGIFCNLYSVKNVMSYACFGNLLVCFMTILIFDTNRFYLFTLIETLFLMTASFFVVPFHICTILLFQVRERYKKISTGYTLGRIISNFMPAILIFLWGRTESILMLISPILIFSTLSIYTIKHLKGENYVS